MKRGLLIYPSTTPRGNNAFGWFREAAARYGMEIEVLFYDSPGAGALAGAPAWTPDFVLMRGYNTALSRWYEAQGVTVVNSTDSMILCRDKYRSAVVLAAAGSARVYGIRIMRRLLAASDFLTAAMGQWFHLS